MRHFEMRNIMGNYLWYENIDGKWELLADHGDPGIYRGVSMGCDVESVVFHQFSIVPLPVRAKDYVK